MWLRHGLSLWESRIRRTVSAEMAGTIPSSTNARASSAQSHCDRDRPRWSGRSLAIVTRCIATSGVKKRFPATAGFIVQPSDAVFAKPLGPFVDKATADVHRAGNVGNRGTIGQHEDDPAAFGQSGSNGSRTLPRRENLSLVRGEVNNHTGFASLCHVRGLRVRVSSYPPLGNPSDELEYFVPISLWTCTKRVTQETRLPRDIEGSCPAYPGGSRQNKSQGIPGGVRSELSCRSHWSLIVYPVDSVAGTV